MELKEFLQVLRRSWLLVAMTTAICVIAAIIITSIIPSKYSSSIDVYVSRKAVKESDQYYTYDGYYSSQSSIQYTNTVSGLFQSSQIIREAATLVQSSDLYVKGDKDPEVLGSDVDYLKQMSKNITVEDIAPQILTVSFKYDDTVGSRLWITSLGKVVQDKVAELNLDSDGNFRVDISAEPLIEEIKPSFTINIIVSLMSGLLIGTLWSFAKVYFKNEK